MAKGKYYTPEFKEQAVKMVAGLDCTYDLLHAPRVLDLGAGTGKLTAALLALGAEVIAVEPDPAMLTEPRRALS